MLLIIYGLMGGHTHSYAYPHESDFRKPGSEGQRLCGVNECRTAAQFCRSPNYVVICPLSCLTLPSVSYFELCTVGMVFN